MNKKFSNALQLVDTLEQSYGALTGIRMARARMNVWNKEYKAGDAIYQELLEETNGSFDLHMGIAESHRAQNDLTRAIQQIEQALTFIPTQPDALRLLAKLKLEDHPHIELKAHYMKDNGENQGYHTQLNIGLGRWGRFRPQISLFRQEAFHGQLTEEGFLYRATLGTTWQASTKLQLHAYGGMAWLTHNEVEPLQFAKLQAGFSYALGKTQTIGLTYMNDVQNYSASLLRFQVRGDHLKLTYHGMAGKLGLYTQGIYTSQSDENIRKLMFASLYYLMKDNPALKAGINVFAFGFQESGNPAYFSPSFSRSLELFIQFSNLDHERSRLKVDVLVAGGTQKTDDLLAQSTTRIQLGLGYQAGQRLRIMGNFIYSNSAQATFQGYSYTQVGLHAIYRF